MIFACSTTMLVTRAEEWSVEAETMKEAQALLASGATVAPRAN
jgi:hypothetical protein